MIKAEKDYLKEYGDVSNDKIERIGQFLKKEPPSKKVNVYEEINQRYKINWQTLSFTIYLVPKPTPRPRYSNRNFTFYVKGAGDNKKFMKELFRNEDITLITTPCIFNCTSYLPIPKSMKRHEKVLAELGFIYPISKPDWDNLAKTYCDMIQGVLLYDDSLIVEGTMKKRYSFKPRIEIMVSYMMDYDSEWNKQKIEKKGR